MSDVAWPATEVEAILERGILEVHVGVPGPAGPKAPPPALYRILGVASFSAAHLFDYAPRVTLTDDGGREVETDTQHIPGAVVLSFPGPFTGYLTLS